MAWWGPACKHTGPTNGYFPLIIPILARTIKGGLVGLSGTTHEHDGRVLFEVLEDNAVLKGKQGDRNLIARLAQTYKDINAPVRPSSAARPSRSPPQRSTGDDSTYQILEAQLARLTNERNAIAQKMIAMLEGVAFDGNNRLSRSKAELLIVESDLLMHSIALDGF